MSRRTISIIASVGLATDTKNELRFGKGGVDDAEVILHEYGHAIHFSQSVNFYVSDESGAIGEGFADWDSVSYTTSTPHCLSRVDTDLHYPEDLNGRVHHDEMIWSRALWDIRNGLADAAKVDTIILEAQFDFPGTTMADLAQRTVDAARALYPGSEVVVHAVFEARGILP